MRVIIENTIPVDLDEESVASLKSVSIALDEQGFITPQKIDLDYEVLSENFFEVIESYGFTVYSLYRYDLDRYVLEIPKEHLDEAFSACE